MMNGISLIDSVIIDVGVFAFGLVFIHKRQLNHSP